MFEIIDIISGRSSNNDKLDILRQHRDNMLLKKVLWYTYNPMLNYYVKEYNSFIDWEAEEDSNWYTSIDCAFGLLDALSSRKLTGNAAIDALEDMSLSMDMYNRNILKKIINRDMDCGIGIKTINKVWPDLIPVVPYMRCSLINMLNKINYPAVVQQKCDGMFVNVIYKDGNIKFFTRNGTEFELSCLKQELLYSLQYQPKEYNIVFHGELLVSGDEGSVESRKIGNGLINSLIKKEQTLRSLQEKLKATVIGKAQTKISSEITKKMAEYESTDNRLELVVWDMVTYEEWIDGDSSTPYSERFNSLKQFIGDHVNLVEYEEVNFYEEALRFYGEQIAHGYEGAVLKNWSMLWKNHTSPEQIKLKAERDCELEVIGYEPGTGKYKGGIGSLICKSSDFKLVVSVGSGLSDKDRGFERKDINDSSKGLVLLDSFDPNCYTGSIVTVKFNEVISSEGKDTYSLFLPRLIEIRLDKNTADSFETIRSL